MQKIEYHKLVRDRIPEIMTSVGKVFHAREGIDDEEFANALRRKAIEEAEEVGLAINRDELVKELADLSEVVLAIRSLYRISHAEIEKIRLERLEKRGGFSKRILLEWTEDDGYGKGLSM